MLVATQSNRGANSNFTKALFYGNVISVKPFQ